MTVVLGSREDHRHLRDVVREVDLPHAAFVLDRLLDPCLEAATLLLGTTGTNPTDGKAPLRLRTTVIRPDHMMIGLLHLTAETTRETGNTAVATMTVTRPILREALIRLRATDLDLLLLQENPIAKLPEKATRPLFRGRLQ